MKKSFRVSLAGILVGLSLMSMFMSGIFPFAEYSCPAIAGILLVVLVVEFGCKYAFMAYVAVSILSLLVVANKESVFLFIAFLGYYPILKSKFENLKSRVLEYVTKLLLFNTAIVTTYFLMIKVLDMTQLIEEIEFAKYGALALLLAGNITFIVYDIALTRLITTYIKVIKPKYLNKLIK